jgi:3-phenylpropionate/cinnamic acid dioxygenase small subunit
MTESSLALVAELKDFIEDEAALLDESRFDEWLNLFASDGKYWVPCRRGQTDPVSVPSIFYEDKDILAIRIRRASHPANLAQIPLPRTSHVLGRIRLEKVEHDLYEVSSRMIMVEYRESDGQRLFGGDCRHVLRRDGGRLQIVLKRVDLINCDGPHSFITMPI